MGKVQIRKFTYLEHEIAVIRERRNIPPVSKLEPSCGIEVRYGLKFDGQITDWSDFVQATEDETAANNIAELGLRRARTLRNEARSAQVFPAA